MQENASHKVGFISLGCPKALVDSERILTELKSDGYDVVPTYDQADLVIVNTCGFIDAAKAESLETIGEALNENGKVIVTGCMGANAEDITIHHPSVLSVTGPQAYEEVMSAVHQHLPKPTNHAPFDPLVPPQGVKLTPRHYAYLKISEGCNHRCSFCIIPSMRGNLVSRPADAVLAEAERLVESGVQEILVISQDTSAYGVDLKYKTTFWNGRPVKTNMVELAKALGSLGVWVRMHYVYPYPHVDDVIPLMADNIVLPYLDIPFQHGSPKILKAMKRPGQIEKTLDRVHAWRKQCPDLTIRSTFIVGFPGETDEDFQMLLDFQREAQLDRVGCFQYSPVDGASANKLADHVPEDVKQERHAIFMEAQAGISTQRLSSKVGKNIEVLIDQIGDDGAIGRSWADAPEIDGRVLLEDEFDHKPGDRVQAVVEEADTHDLWARSI
ncbi:MAG TPA: 30S ribosomal protein S12 methylthiotransferase RimO [Gammaproteobacteria bacterium]|jgi:ribosomal protein S12 methylthiotransferase|nr:30S ribosomal protein S12 methylthiotransferase RimO [Gammaproteobacteria bacterium]